MYTFFVLPLLLATVYGAPCTDQNNANRNFYLHSGTCQCGGATCSAGEKCTASSSLCEEAPTCSNTDGITENSADCRCGTATCVDTTAYRNLFCKLSENKCEIAAPCTQTDGSTANSAYCMCGTAFCWDKLFCTASSSLCAEALPGATLSDKVTALETKVAKLETDLAAIVAQYSLIDDVCKKTTGGRRVADTETGCGGDASSDSTTSPAPASEDAFLNAANRSSVGYLFIVSAIVAIFTGL